MPGKIIIANWKMNGNFSLAHEINNYLVKMVNAPNKIIICTPSIFFNYFDHQKVNLGAQDISVIEEEYGAYTGEISGKLLKYSGCEHVLIGHSERRQYFNENNEILNKKLQNALKFNIQPIFCVGETKEEYDKQLTAKVLEDQLKIIKNLPVTDQLKVIIAYEPVWSIGTGLIPDLKYISKVKDIINKLFEKNLKIVYGGSVNTGNANEILNSWPIDGALIGGASLKLPDFKKIISFAE
ncbi:MAG: triose-phosphate isomerase [Sphingobacteriia bacterium]|nr:triose-phosphate isomerase [Sphingobacteriia bacterium]